MSCVFFSSRRRHTSGALVTGVQTCALPIFERLRAGEPNDSDMMTRLVATGLLGRCDGPTSIEPASVEIPSRDLAAARYNGFDLRMTVAAGLALRRARRAMRSERIAQTIKQARRRRSMIEQDCDEDAAEATAASYAANRCIHPVPHRRWEELLVGIEGFSTGKIGGWRRNLKKNQ